MNTQGQEILLCLQQVAAERAVRAADAELAAGAQAVKHFQQQRFAQTYGDLMASERHGPATRFFLEELYGPSDFSQRDTQFARIVPALVRLFSQEMVGTVLALAQLHALSEQLDTAMAGCLRGVPASGVPAAYARAWRDVGRAVDREQQICLVLAVGAALDRYTRKPLLRQSLRMMRGPAQAAGLGALQRFLEQGFDTFRAMRGADTFLETVARRERGLAALLFAGGDVAAATGMA